MARPQKRQRPQVAGESKSAELGGDLHANANPLSHERAWQLLLHSVDLVSCAAAVILSEGRISNAGREVLTYTAIRLRQIREVME